MMNSSSTGGNPTAEKIAPYVLLGMTAVTGLVDAVSFLSLGSVDCGISIDIATSIKSEVCRAS
jgi:hypothetical protein